MAVEPLTILSFATLFVKGAVQKGGQSLTEGAIARAPKLWDAIRDRLGREQPKAVPIMEEVERDPNETNLKRLAGLLAFEMGEDPVFAGKVTQLAQEIQQALDRSENHTNISMKVENSSMFTQLGQVNINAKEINL